MQIKSLKHTLCASATVALLTLASLPAQAADADALEAKLDKAMQLIEAQSKQMEQLSGELAAIKAREARSISTLAPAAGDSSISHAAIEERLAEVEDTVFDLDDKIGSRAVVNAFDAVSLDIGGFVHTTFTHIDSDSGSASAWDTQNFELLIKADLDEQWSAFFAGGFLREENDGIVLDNTGQNPNFDIANKTPQIIGWVNYKHNDALNVQIGRMITPHGIINIEHFPQVLLDPRQPQFLRPFSGDTIFPNFVTGAQVHGKFFLENDNSLQYNAYAAAAQSDPEAMIYGGRVSGTHGASGITLGLNAATGARTDTDSDSDYLLYGADLLIDNGWLLWKSEVFATSEDEAGMGDRLGWYTQPAWRINDKWTVFYRYDFLDNGITGGGVGATGFAAGQNPGGDSIENVVGITFKPKPNVHLRITGTHLDLEQGGTVTEDRDATIVQGSATVSF